ncbi:MAG: transglutaminase-like domain-containing protein, partial [Candidatus Poribacteria bacterium]|nr:transglutaminase-like domain-containing protein [Candidatus Poribacteria bacterium]
MAHTDSDVFFHLSQLESHKINLAEGALLIARDAYPDLDIGVYLRQLDQMAAELQAEVDQESDTNDQIRHLNRYLFDKQGFVGNRDDYYDPRNSYLNDVLERKVGIPITLSIVYMEVGNRIGLPLVGVGFPGHFIVKHKTLETFIDPFEGGRILSDEALSERLAQVFREPVPIDQQFLQAMTTKQILARMLRNLKQVYFRQEKYEEAIRAGEKIIWLEPQAAQDYRGL